MLKRLRNVMMACRVHVGGEGNRNGTGKGKGNEKQKREMGK